MSKRTQILMLALLMGCASGMGSGTAQELAADEESATRVLKIATVQAAPDLDPANNLRRATEFCRVASEQQVDIVLFPEMFSVGYQTAVDFENDQATRDWKAKAQSTDSPYVDHFRDLAQELRMGIAITYLENRNGALRNATSLIDRHGKVLFTYAKVHTCRFFPMEGALTPGEEFFVDSLDTAAGLVQIGVMTCYDREFPESARILMLRGAEIILTPNACGLDDLRLKQFQIRAWENSVVTVMANYASGPGNGRSCAYAADGQELLLADDGEGVYIAEIDLQEMRKTRAKTFWGNAWRRPALYEKLLSGEIQSPFHRTDAFNRPNSEDLGTPQP